MKYTSFLFFRETRDINKSTKKNTQWQLSVKGGKDQYQLDAGQKRFGATQCPECNVVYQIGDAEDENAHLNYHNSIRTLRFQVNFHISFLCDMLLKFEFMLIL